MPTERPDHLERPHLRPLQPIPIKREEQPVIMLRDPLMLSDEAMAVPPPAMQALQMCDGTNSIDQIAGAVKQSRELIEQLVDQMDARGLLWGPTFKQLESDKKASLTEHGAFPVRGTGPLGTDTDAIAKQFDHWLEQTEDPEIEFEPSIIFTPQLEYPHTWPIFAGCWHAMRAHEKPDRIVVFSNNAFGIGDGVCMTRLGFETPLGRMDPDTAAIDAMARSCGECVFADELDHMANLGIEMALPWVQHCWGNTPIVGVLIPDPLQEQIEDDGERMNRGDFTTALRECLDTLGGRTLCIGSGDLSHVGPQFGEPRPIDDQRRFDVEQNDRDLLGHVVGGDSEAFLSAIAWTMNPTRWSGSGSMAALLETKTPDQIELIDYRQAVNGQNTALISCAGLVMA
jgi:AmmeMemoRadiSam system protein B